MAGITNLPTGCTGAATDIHMAVTFSRHVGVIGGAGRVGLPLALTFADCGLKTAICDIDSAKVRQIAGGHMPFQERGAEEMLRKTLASGNLEVFDSAEVLASCESLVCIIGTPVDEHLNPSFRGIHQAIDRCAAHLRDGQIFVLRSTVFPGTSQHIQHYLQERRLDIQVAFCPERVAQGESLREFRELPQIISAFDSGTLARVRGLFGGFVREFIEMTPIEAEICKLMTNSWRYIQFAAVNQFYMIATQHGLDFNRILHGCRHNYPRMKGLPGPGLAAGPCLVKDTMQLAAFSHNQFMLGHAAMLINEGLPMHMIELARREIELASATAGILGMAFKADSDDSRDSLSYKLRKLLMLEAGKVLCADPYVRNADFPTTPLEQVIAEADVLFVATPHAEYRRVQARPGTVVIDPWNHLPTSGTGDVHP